MIDCINSLFFAVLGISLMRQTCCAFFGMLAGFYILFWLVYTPYEYCLYRNKKVIISVFPAVLFTGNCPVWLLNFLLVADIHIVSNVVHVTALIER